MDFQRRLTSEDVFVHECAGRSVVGATGHGIIPILNRAARIRAFCVDDGGCPLATPHFDDGDATASIRQSSTKALTLSEGFAAAALHASTERFAS
jgi:hypothetical protein